LTVKIDVVGFWTAAVWKEAIDLPAAMGSEDTFVTTNRLTK
jgi:hypothetical protein